MKQQWCVLFLAGDFDSSIQAKQKQAVKILELLVYKAAQTGAKQFIEMISSTSAQQIVFDSYKDRTPLPEDVARANGHCNLAQYLQDITTRSVLYCYWMTLNSTTCIVQVCQLPCSRNLDLVCYEGLSTNIAGYALIEVLVNMLTGGWL